MRLNYVALAVHLAYAPAHSGQGVQAFVGPYLGALVGGHRVVDDLIASPQPVEIRTRVAGGGHPYPLVDRTYYSQQLDAGVQAGLGYRAGPLLVQADYSWGLRNLTPPVVDENNNIIAPSGFPSYSRAFQASCAYLWSRNAQPTP
ncbi:outer membrane beta-barrel protein [Hymenobacter sedentarius]|uniref:outer membrane beta-barrel protein n=1 Tax=Hymenobacter sedentarius TaxID=1411621 RepID=UPI00090067ED|nr:outer membrane beta-barrel protein [Hymenobacter sedentarius]